MAIEVPEINNMVEASANDAQGNSNDGNIKDMVCIFPPSLGLQKVIAIAAIAAKAIIMPYQPMVKGPSFEAASISTPYLTGMPVTPDSRIECESSQLCPGEIR